MHLEHPALSKAGSDVGCHVAEGPGVCPYTCVPSRVCRQEHTWAAPLDAVSSTRRQSPLGALVALTPLQCLLFLPKHPLQVTLPFYVYSCVPFPQPLTQKMDFDACDVPGPVVDAGHKPLPSGSRPHCFDNIYFCDYVVFLAGETPTVMI